MLKMANIAVANYGWIFYNLVKHKASNFASAKSDKCEFIAKKGEL